MNKLISKGVRQNIRQGKDLDIVIPLFLGIFASVIAILGLPFSDNRLSALISALTLSILSFLALSLLNNRVDREKSENSMIQIESSLAQTEESIAQTEASIAQTEKYIAQIPTSQNLRMRFRGDYEETVRQLIINSNKSIWIIVRTGKIIYQRQSELKDALERGCTINLVICNSNNDSLKRIIEFESEHDQETIEGMFKEGERGYEYLCKQHHENNYSGVIERKIIGFPPPQLMYITDFNGNNGNSNSTAFITPFVFDASVRLAPSILFTFNDDKELFRYYFKQINDIWKSQANDYN